MASLDFAYCPDFESVRQLAVRLKEHADEDVKNGLLPAKPTARPYPPTSQSPRFWYLTPAPVNPAYHLGKFIVSSETPEVDALVGVWFEKGLEHPEVPSERMTPDWIWHKALSALRSGFFDRFMDVCQTASGIRPAVSVIAGFGIGGEPQRLTYRYDRGRLELAAATSAESHLSEPADISSLPELASAINGIPQLGFLWVSLIFGIAITSDVDGSAAKFTSSDVWNSACLPFAGWFGASAPTAVPAPVVRAVSPAIPPKLPDEIPLEQLISAIRRIEEGESHAFADSIAYDVLHEGKRYPPKAVVGLAASSMLGYDFGPADFKGGLESKCFRILKDAGLTIVPKTHQAAAAWIFQGNPDVYRIEDYLGEFRYIYWKAPKHADRIKVGDRCYVWRSGPRGGVIASGWVVEPPKKLEEVDYPESLGEQFWMPGSQSDSPGTIEVGIQVDVVRIDEEDGFLPRPVLKDDPIFRDASIIKMPNGTVFPLTEVEASRLAELWAPEAAPTGLFLPEAMEGARRLRQHYARERNRALVKSKKKQFADAHEGRVYCEVCLFDFSRGYPRELGEGFIEVHHLLPLSDGEEPRRTKLEDLLLVCSNCHRMVHRPGDVDANLRMLLDHFATTS